MVVIHVKTVLAPRRARSESRRREDVQPVIPQMMPGKLKSFTIISPT